MKLFSLFSMFFVAFIAMNIFGTSSFVLAQQQVQQQVQIIKPSIAISEIIFILQLLDKIEVKGSEVDALLEVKNVMVPPVLNAQKEKKPLTDVLTLYFNIQQAQALLGFLQRATINGADAERYRRFIDAILISANPKK